MALGYGLPGTVLYDNTTPSSVQTTSAQRTPCFIGLASPTVFVSKESVTRGSGSADSLAYTSNGIYNVTAIGSSSGMNNFKENTHWQLVNNQVSWLPKVQYAESAIISNILTPISYVAVVGTPVSGTNAGFGTASITTSPNLIVGSSLCGLPTNTYSLGVTVNGGSLQSLSVAVTGSTTWTNIATAINGTLTGATATVTGGKIVIASSTATTTSVTSSIVISNGTGANPDLIAAINALDTYTCITDTGVQGTNSTSGYNTISYGTLFNAGDVSGLTTGTFNIHIKVDAGAAADIPVTIGVASTMTDVVTAINTAVTGATTTINSGTIVVTSNTTGTGSIITIGVAASADIFAALATANPGWVKAINTSTQTGVAATNGYQTIHSSVTAFSGGVPARITAGTYYLQVAVNGVSTSSTYAVVVSGSETWNQVAALLNSALSTVVTVPNVNAGKIIFNSKINGALSSVTISDGAVSGFLSAIDAITSLYIVLDITAASVNGIAATSGYANITSSPSNFAPTTPCNLPSGQYEIKVTPDGGSQQVVTIQVTDPTQTWSSVISGISMSGATASIVSNAIQIKSSTTSTSSTIAIVDGTNSGKEFLYTLNNLTATSINVTVPALQYVRTAAETNIDVISGANTYNYTVSTNIVDAQTTLTLHSTLSSLKALAVGSVLNLTTVGSWISTGATYYVSYNYTRPDSDYGVYKLFNDYNMVLADLGTDIATNPVVNLCNLALNLYGVPAVGVVQVKNATKSSFQNALTAIKYKNVQDVCVLSTDPDVRSYVITEVTERSLPSSRRYRMAYLGAEAGTVVGDESNSHSLRGIVSTIKNKRVVFPNATRGIYYYTDASGNQQSTLVDGSFIACAIGAFHAAFPDPTTTLLNKSIPGIDLLESDFDNYYSEYQLVQAGSSSCFLVKPSAAGGMLVIDDLTTDNSTVETNNINIVDVEDYIASDVIVQMDKFHGKLIRDPKAYAGNIKKNLDALFAEYQRNGIISGVGYTTATISPARHDTILIGYGYYAVYTHKYTEGTYELLV